MQLMAPTRAADGPGGGRRQPAGDDVKGFLIFLGIWFVVTQFILPRFGLRPG